LDDELYGSGRELLRASLPDGGGVLEVLRFNAVGNNQKE